MKAHYGSNHDPEKETGCINKSRRNRDLCCQWSLVLSYRQFSPSRGVEEEEHSRGATSLGNASVQVT